MTASNRSGEDASLPPPLVFTADSAGLHSPNCNNLACIKHRSTSQSRIHLSSFVHNDSVKAQRRRCIAAAAAHVHCRERRLQFTAAVLQIYRCYASVWHRIVCILFTWAASSTMTASNRSGEEASLPLPPLVSTADNAAYTHVFA